MMNPTTPAGGSAVRGGTDDEDGCRASGQLGRAPFLEVLGATVLDSSGDVVRMAFTVPRADALARVSRLAFAAALADTVLGRAVAQRSGRARFPVTSGLSVWGLTAGSLSAEAGSRWTAFARVVQAAGDSVLARGKILDGRGQSVAEALSRVMPLPVAERQGVDRGAVHRGGDLLGASVVEAVGDGVRQSIEWSPALVNSAGVMHGGAIALHLAAAAAAAAGPGFVLEGMEVAYLAPVVEGVTEIDAKILRRGVRNVAVRADIAGSTPMVTSICQLGRDREGTDPDDS